MTDRQFARTHRVRRSEWSDPSAWVAAVLLTLGALASGGVVWFATENPRWFWGAVLFCAGVVVMALYGAASKERLVAVHDRDMTRTLRALDDAITHPCAGCPAAEDVA